MSAGGRISALDRVSRSLAPLGAYREVQARAKRKPHTARDSFMADPTTFPEEHVREPLVYRRISGFAIAGLIVASCYGLIVVVACISGLSKGMPVLLSPWLQVLAVVGAGLAIAALVHV